MSESQQNIEPDTPTAAIDYPKPRLEFLCVCVLIIIGFLLRIWNIATVPPGLWFDEAINGIDALNILATGETPIFFQYQVFPREPLYVYLIVPFVWLFGAEPWAIRLASVLVGTITLPIAWLFVREWFDKRTALIALACFVFLRWHIHFSRTGFRTILSPTFLLLGFYFLHCGIRKNRLREYAFAGIVFAGGFYTYLSFRLAPIVGLVWFSYYAWVNRKQLPSNFFKGIGVMCVTGMIVLAPLVIHYTKNPEHFSGRSDQINLFKLENGESGFAEILRNTRDVALMFSFRGDHVPKHNVPERNLQDGTKKVPMPIFDPIASIAFYLGLLLLLSKCRKNHASVLVIAWFFIMTLNSILSFGAPNILRTLILSPMAALMLALGLIWIFDKLKKVGMSKYAALAIVTVLFSLFALQQTYSYYFIFPKQSSVHQDFNDNYVRMGRIVNGLSEKSDVYLPGDWFNHPTIKYVTFNSSNIYELTLPEGLSKTESNRSRIIVYTYFTNIDSDLKKLFPTARYIPILDHQNQPFAMIVNLRPEQLKERGNIEKHFKGRIGESVFPNR